MNFAKASTAAGKKGLLLAIALGLGACSSGGDGSTGALLDGGSGSGGGGGTAGATLVITGPLNETSGGVTVASGSETPGFKVTLRNSRGVAIANKFVGIRVSSPTTNGGSISGKVGASDNDGGAQTNSSGIGTFTYIAPESVTAKRSIVLTATFDESTTDTIDPVTATFNLSVNPPPKGKLTLTNSGIPSGSLRLGSGDINEDFEAILLTDEADPQPLPNEPVTFSFVCGAGTGALLSAPVDSPGNLQAETDENGRIAFGFTAPVDVRPSATTCTITARPDNTIGGTRPAAVTYRVGVEVSPEPVITMGGPRNLQSGGTNEGYTVRVTHSDGSTLKTVPCVRLSATAVPAFTSGTRATFLVNESFPRCGTDSYQLVTQPLTYSVVVPDGVAANTEVTITAATTLNTVAKSQTYRTTVLKDVFTFVLPEENAVLPVGLEPPRGEVRVQWTTNPDGAAGAQPIRGTGRLTISGTNTGTFFRVGTVTLMPGQPADVTFGDSGNGSFNQTVFVASNNSGQNTITLNLTSESGATLNASRLVSFQNRSNPDEIRSMRLTVTPAVVKCFPNAGRFSNLALQAENSAGAPAVSVDVIFDVTNKQDPGIDNVFPTTQTTDSQGRANSSFEAGGVPGTVTVTARIENGGSIVSSSSRPIVIEAPTADEIADGAKACVPSGP